MMMLECFKIILFLLLRCLEAFELLAITDLSLVR